MNILISPETVDSAEDLRLASVAAALLGQSVDRVSYSALPGESWPTGHRNDSLIHEVDVAVELVLSSGDHLRISWGTPGLGEGLLLELADLSTLPDHDPLGVDERSEWARRLHRPVTNVGVGFYSYNGDAPDRPWSIRLGMGAESHSVVVALGEMEGEEPAYSPDALLVIFSSQVARAYDLRDARSSAWGVELAP